MCARAVTSRELAGNSRRLIKAETNLSESGTTAVCADALASVRPGAHDSATRRRIGFRLQIKDFSDAPKDPTVALSSPGSEFWNLYPTVEVTILLE